MQYLPTYIYVVIHNSIIVYLNKSNTIAKFFIRLPKNVRNHVPLHIRSYHVIPIIHNTYRPWYTYIAIDICLTKYIW